MTSGAAKSVTLCADDYAISPGVSRAIIELIEASRLSATGCMTASPFWPEHAAWLKPHAGKVDVGLHLTLTDHRPLGDMPGMAPKGRMLSFGRLARAAYLGRLDGEEVGAEIERQLSSFEAAMGGPPRFIDGHHHVHQLPVVRERVLALFRDRVSGGGTYLRMCWDKPWHVLRRGAALRAFAVGLPGRTLLRMARGAGIPFNSGFAGFYDFSGHVAYSALFPRFLAGADDGFLVMCHPGHVDAELRIVDSLTDQREIEYAYFLSDDFPRALDRAGLRLGRFGAGSRDL